ncbi:MAG TPA: hypothetical protein PL196_01890 [Burkholderiaceae bacterium]|nr:hypothetical protein [Burkholderiaceae bacterium]
MSFSKILIANRGDSGRAATASAKPNRVLRAAQAGEIPAMESGRV